MLIVILNFIKFAKEVDRHIEAHKAWVKQGFDDGVLVLAGGQRPRIGGALFAIGDERVGLLSE